MKIINVIALSAFLLLPFLANAQHEDCDIAQVICSDGPVIFNSEGAGINDFLDPGNHPGCLLTFENQSSWYYFEFNTDMPPNSIIEFTIEPNGGFTEDYDFAIYGPDVPCDDLDFPVRCSFANFLCDLCPLTGLGMGATDTSEGAQNEDGFVAPMTVQPGEGYYMILDNWYGSSDGFTLTWGGSAAAYLNCNANPACNNLGINAGVDLPICAGAGLALSASLSNASPNATVFWTEPDGAQQFLSDSSILQPTFYPPIDRSGPVTFTVTVVDGECQKSDSVTINVRAAPQVEIIGDSLYCPNTTASLESNDNYVSYEWSTTETGDFIEIDTAGTYWLRVEHVNGCFATDTLDIIAVEEPMPVIQGDAQICEGDSTQLSLSNDYDSFLWNDTSDGSSLMAFAPGGYSVMVTDSNGCSAEAFFTLDVNPLPQPSIAGLDAICDGDSSLLSVNDSFVTYQWSNGFQEPMIQVQAEGAYSLTVTDENGCEGQADFSLTVNELPTPVVMVGAPFCPGDSTLVSLTESYTSYLWSNGETNNLVYALAGGSFSVTVTNEFGCAGAGMAEAIMYDAPVPEILGDTAFCSGGALTLMANEMYNGYLWPDGTTDATFDVSSGGNISLTVTDENGCQGTTAQQITEHMLPVPEIQGAAGFCPGESVSLSTLQNWQTYLWSNGQSSSSIEVNSADDYGLTITDENGCAGSTSQLVEAYPTPEPQITGALQFCPGTSTVLSTTESYAIYDWGSSAAPSLTVSSAGNYALTVTDNNGCTGETTESVSFFEVIPPEIPQVQGFCAGESITVEAGMGYQAYLWSNNETGQALEIMTPGNYGLTVTDLNNCVSSTNFMVEEYVLPQPEIQGVTGLCPGDSGTLTTPGIYVDYLWSDGTTNASLPVNSPGTFGLMVTDENGCQGAAFAEILAFSNPEPEIQGDPSICPDESTLLTLTQSYSSYQWIGGEITPMLSVSEPGMVEVVVTNEMGCAGQASFEVQGLAAPEFDIDGDTTFCAGGNTILSVPAQFANYQWAPSGQFPEIQVSEPGTYSVTVTNDEGCTASQSLLVEEIPLPTVQVGPAPTLDCNLTSAIIGDDNPLPLDRYVYNWTGPEIDPDDQHLPQIEIQEEGTYQVVVEDDWYGCFSEVYSVMVDDISYEPQIGFDPVESLDCTVLTTIIDASSSDNNAGNIYEWLDATGFISTTTEPMLEVNEGGWYYLNLQDTITGCAAIDSVFVEADQDFPEVQIEVPGILNCYEPSLNLDAGNSSSGANFNYQWTTQDGNIQADANTLTPVVDNMGWYVLSIQNENNDCLTIDSVFVNQDVQPPLVNAGADLALDCILRSVQLDGSNSSSGSGYDIKWTDEQGLPLPDSETLLPEVDQAGLYQLSITNLVNGCSASDDVQVNDLADYPTATDVSLLPPRCFGESNGQIVVNSVENGTPPYAYTLDGQVFSMDGLFENLEAGDYELTIEDAAGCALSVPLVIESGSPIAVTLGGDRHINLGESLLLEPFFNQSGLGPVQYDWAVADGDSCLNCKELNIRPFETGTVQVVATDENGCQTSDMITIFVARRDEVFIPNAFSPNDDGINDFFMVYSGEDVEMIRSLMVLDRWGGKVFDDSDLAPNDSTRGWDGNFRSKKAAPAVYAYVIEVEFIDGRTKIFKGDVTLIR